MDYMSPDESSKEAVRKVPSSNIWADRNAFLARGLELRSQLGFSVDI
jgi:hypothetical protein